MKTLVCTRPGIFEYHDAPEPVGKEDYSLIRIKRIGICGTDLHAFEGTQPFFSYPRILGHELAGELIEPNGAIGFNKGETVTIVPYFYCGQCIACRLGKPNCCVQIQVCGVHCNGGMAEYLSVPSYSLVHGEGLSLNELALIEPLAIGAHGVERAGIKTGEHVLVVGAGPIGLCTMLFAKLEGANVMAMDRSEERLSFCRTVLGIQHTVNASSSGVTEKLSELTNGDMHTVVIDATGNLTAINNGFQFIAHGGRYVLIGLQKEHVTFSHPEFHKREATLMSSRNATRKDFDKVIAAIKDKKVNPSAFITHQVLFDQVKERFADWIDPRNGVIKAMVTME